MDILKGILWLLFVLPLLLIRRIVAAVTGWFILPFLIPFAYSDLAPHRPPEMSKRKVSEGWYYVRLPSWANNIWGNKKYGALGNWFWYDEHKGSYLSQYIWLGWRNPANALDTPIRIDANSIKVYGAPEVDDVAGKAGFQFITSPKGVGLYFIIPIAKGWGIRCRLGLKLKNKSEVQYVRPSYLIPMPQKFGR